MNLFLYEQKLLKAGYQKTVGCDEVGRGSLAGPIVAAAVQFDPQIFHDTKQRAAWMREVRDSKMLKPNMRELLAQEIKRVATAWSITLVSPSVIDRINIHQANLRAMRKSVDSVIRKGEKNKTPSLPLGRTQGISPRRGEIIGMDYRDERAKREKGGLEHGNTIVIVDGKFEIPGLSHTQHAEIQGDARIFSIACASILAKVYRDNLMVKQDVLFPEYGFAKHKGYGTAKHITAIKNFGITPIHRNSFCSAFVD